MIDFAVSSSMVYCRGRGRGRGRGRSVPSAGFASMHRVGVRLLVKAPEGYCSGFGVVWYGVRREEKREDKRREGKGREGKGEKKAGI